MRHGCLPLVLLVLAAATLLLVVPLARGKDDAGSYVGANACTSCHLLPAEHWSTSTHRLTLQEPRPDNVPPAIREGKTVTHPPGATTWHVVSGAQGTRYEAETTGADGTPQRFPLAYVVGRERINMFLTRLDDGRLQVLPSMREVPTDRWFDYTQLVFGGPDADPMHAPVIAPGDPSFWTGPVRAFGPRCMGCHVSGETVEAPSPDGTLGERAWRALGVDCEECHGPGGGHVAHQGGAGGEDPILAFTGLARETALGVCLRCHMEGEKLDRAMRPGEDLFEHLDPTLLDDASRVDPVGRPLELIYDGLSFLASTCAREGAMTCVTCHDPHGGPLDAQMAAPPHEAVLCADCHAAHAADPAAHAHHPAGAPGGRCVDCHMPKVVIERGHGVMTDHTLSIPRPDLESDRVAVDACTGCHTGQRGAPPGAPPLDRDALIAARDRWWPEARPLRPWEAALVAARADPDGRDATLARLAEAAAMEGAPRVYRASAARLLGRHAERARPALLALTASPDSLVRREALGALASLRGEEVDRALFHALGDRSKPVRRRAARTALAGWTRVQDDPAFLDAILPILEQDAEDVPDDDLRWFRLAAARELAGDLEGAIDAYERQVALDHLNRHIPPHLAKLRARLAAEAGGR